MMAHNINMFFFYVKYWWVTSYEIVVRIIYLKGLFPHLNEWIPLIELSHLPLFPITDTLERLLEKKFLGDSSYELFCGTEDFIIIFMALNIVLENYFEDVLALVD